MVELAASSILTLISSTFITAALVLMIVTHRARRQQDAATERIIESQEKIIQAKERVIQAERDRNSHLWYSLAISSGDPQMMRMVRKAYGPHGVLDGLMESRGISLEETPQG